jgi:CBS domain-containing protein
MIAVHEIMSTSPVAVGPATPVSDLLALFDRHDFNAFPVLDERGRLLGIVSKLDVLELFLADGAPTRAAAGAVGTTRVEDLMHRKVVSVEAREPISTAGALMVETKLRSLPVVERQDDRLILVGMLSRGDVLRGLRFQLVEGGYVRQVPVS